MTAEPTRTIKQSRVHNLLGKAAGGYDTALNRFLVGLGDKCGLYATGQHSFDMEGQLVQSKPSSIGVRRKTSAAADGAFQAPGPVTPGQERAVSIQREETAFMTLICHDCLAARDSNVATP